MTIVPGTPLAGRVALVTGASRGIGRAVAVALARAGARCIITARTQGALEQTDDLIRQHTGQGATLLPLDLGDGDRVDTLGPSIKAQEGRLDCMVHCAGELGVLSPLVHLQPQDWERGLQAGPMTTWRLIRTLAPLLERAPAGRAVFLTDRHGRAPEPFWGLVAATRAAQDAIVRTWVRELPAHSPLRINLFEPGMVATRLRRLAMPALDMTSLPAPDAIAPHIVRLCLPGPQSQGACLHADVPVQEAST
ncbi:oxidoreductase [Komagataeibacter rhaeticus]|uniref:SDR family NAD(P)-dependent oxidoreductase n=1 Tax=Komagataeibacter rhaeticus TaxID=215221 RepID=UPI0004DAF097|nr:SDR family NAD(P)-dependent oxidoreductase [Komagataeibacter rhaeticus]KDU94827.1 oxidoreductase [Komagataeibacter rhaeticus AF1]MBL7239298.1 SDR family NAD(P)-dependent oxidoreductase [Komagataeibacter rhaeticus]PYD55086.1 oxidoreductase [Komagataeibacter rhaeticus]GBQ16369.1 oxidoreductase [Komagataeibacter rhaeticus DSM 16663]